MHVLSVLKHFFTLSLAAIENPYLYRVPSIIDYCSCVHGLAFLTSRTRFRSESEPTSRNSAIHTSLALSLCADAGPLPLSYHRLALFAKLILSIAQPTHWICILHRWSRVLLPAQKLNLHFYCRVASYPTTFHWNLFTLRPTLTTSLPHTVRLSLLPSGHLYTSHLTLVSNK